MADDLKNKPQKSKEISKHEKAVKADTSNKPKDATHLSTKNKELKKNTSLEPSSTAPPPSDVDQKVKTVQKKVNLIKNQTIQN